MYIIFNFKKFLLLIALAWTFYSFPQLFFFPEAQVAEIQVAVASNFHNPLKEIIEEFEEDQFDTSHEVLGFLIAQTWGLNHSLCSVIAYHHSPSIMLATGEQTEKEIFAILKLAEHMAGATELLYGVNPDL